MKNPISDEKAEAHVNRGGYWDSNSEFVRKSSRVDFGPAYRSNDLGFRLVKNVPKRRNEESSKR